MNNDSTSNSDSSDDESGRLQNPHDLKTVIGSVDDEATSSVVASAEADFPLIEGYQVLSKLGQGGMGVVYEARHVSLDRRVALKLLPGGLAGDPMAIQRFLREARSAAALHHTNIVPVFDVGCSDDSHYYAMQLIEGAPLNDVITDVRSLRESTDTRKKDEASESAAVANMLVTTKVELAPAVTNASVVDETEETVIGVANNDAEGAQNASSPDADLHSIELSTNLVAAKAADQFTDRHYFRTTAQLGLQVAEALQYAHSNGILHRDIKPANLMLDRSCNVWITDFGLAKFVDDDLSVSGTIVGTLRFMSPERFRGEGDERSDIYALGATLYEMLVFRPAFVASDQVDLMQTIQAADPVMLRSIDPHVPRDLETIVHKCLEKDPKRRYATAQEMADDLRRHVNGEPILARRVSLHERLWLWAKKNRAVAALLSALLLGALVVTVASSLATVAFQNLAEDAQNKADTAIAINDFFNRDILGAGNPMEGNVDRNTTLLTVLRSAADQVESRFADKPVVAGQIHLTIGEAFVALAEFESAEDHLLKAQTLLTNELGEDHPDVQEVHLQLGKMFRDSVSDFRRGYRMLDAVQKRRVRDFGFEDPRSLEASYELALALTHSDRRAEGVKLLKKVLQERTRSLGENDRRTILTLVSTGRVEVEDQVRNALPMLQKVFDLAQAEFGDENILTVMARANLADYHMRQRETERAFELLNQNLAVCERWLGRNHPRTIRNLENLAHVYKLAGDHAKATVATRDVADRIRSVHGEDSLVSDAANLAVAASLMNAVSNLEEAREIAEQSRAFRVKAHGEGDHEVAYVDYILGKIDDLEGKTEAAEKRLLQAYETQRQRLGENDDRTNLSMWGVINHYVIAKEFEKAKPLMKKGVAYREHIYGPDSMATIEVKENLAFLHTNLEEYEEAETLLRECIVQAERDENRGLVHAHFANSCRNKLATCLNLQKKYEEAAKVVTPSVEYSQWSPQDQWKRAHAQGILAEALIETGQAQQAEKLLKSAQLGFENDTSHMLPEWRKRNLKKMAIRFVRLYEVIDKPDERNKWQTVLDGFDD